MLNSGRRVDFAIFSLDSPVSIGELQIQAGLQQVLRNEDTYFFKKVGEKIPYVEVPVSENVLVLKILFSFDVFTG